MHSPKPGPLTTLWASASSLSDAVHILISQRRPGPDHEPPSKRKRWAVEAESAADEILEVLQAGAASHLVRLDPLNGQTIAAELADAADGWSGLLATMCESKFDGLRLADVTEKLSAVDRSLKKVQARWKIDSVDSTFAPPSDTSEANAPTLAWANCADLAARHGVNKDALRKKLERWRKTHYGEYRVLESKKKNESTYLYCESTVLPLIRELKAK